jgi:hypothetical protein
MRWVLAAAALMLFLLGVGFAFPAVEQRYVAEAELSVLCFGFAFTILGLAAIVERLDRRN